MVSRRKEQFNWLLTSAALLVLVVLVAALMRVESSYRSAVESVVDSATQAFAASNVLKTPRDINVNIEAVEDLAEYFQIPKGIQRIFVTKRIARRVGAEERAESVLLYPFFYARENPDWPRQFEALRRKAVVVGDEEVGALYFQVDERTLSLVRVSIAGVLLLTVLALSVLIARIFSQERTLSETTEILERNQQELIRMERLALAGLLTANILHDIRKPITNIKHELADLSEALGGFAGATRALRNMREQVLLFFDILRDLNLERFVRSDEADEEYVDVNRVIEQALRLVQYERGSTHLDVAFAPNLPLALARPYRLVQVFSNIVLNAYQALEGRGELRIRTFECASHDVALPAMPRPEANDPHEALLLDDAEPRFAGGGRIAIEIADDGPGIAPEALSQIFSPFYSTKPSDKGTGLGLYISRSIVEQLGGTLIAESREGEGTRFVIELPASD